MRPIRGLELLSVFVPGKAEPEGSTHAVAAKTGARRAFVRQGGSEERRARLVAWRDMVKAALRDEWRDSDEHPLGPVPGPVLAALEFVLPALKAAQSNPPPHTVKPDLDKLVRGIGDCLTGIVIVDDAQIVSLTASKRRARLGEAPGARITVTGALHEGRQT